MKKTIMVNVGIFEIFKKNTITNSMSFLFVS
jgi:hypothetical protein